ncbi:MAG: heme exporter protein CcmB, partial [Hydrogenophaga sp.]|nr:heme exporter protein CcmB [Hydrogenophaga sp.]
MARRPDPRAIAARRLGGAHQPPGRGARRHAAPGAQPVNTHVATHPTAPAAPQGWLEGFRCVFQRDLRIALRRRTDSLAAVVFFVMVVSLFPLGVGP